MALPDFLQDGNDLLKAIEATTKEDLNFACLFRLDTPVYHIALTLALDSSRKQRERESEQRSDSKTNEWDGATQRMVTKS